MSLNGHKSGLHLRVFLKLISTEYWVLLCRSLTLHGTPPDPVSGYPWGRLQESAFIRSEALYRMIRGILIIR